MVRVARAREWVPLLTEPNDATKFPRRECLASRKTDGQDVDEATGGRQERAPFT